MTRTLLAVGAALAVVYTPVSGQTQVHSTFGPGDSHDPFTGWLMEPGAWEFASGFTYAGPETSLLHFRAALFALGVPTDIEARFLSGADMNSATLLETLTVSVSGGAIYQFESLLNPTLSAGNTYWVALRATGPGSAGWYLNDQGLNGFVARGGPGESWTNYPDLTTPAFDVWGGTPGAVPEPGSVLLLATGLLGVGAGAARRRRRRDA